MVKDFGFVNYPKGDSNLSIGETSGMIGINLHFDDELVFVGREEGYASTADMNKSNATVYVNYALSQEGNIIAVTNLPGSTYLGCDTVNYHGSLWAWDSVMLAYRIAGPITFLTLTDLIASATVGVPSTVTGTTVYLVRGSDGKLDGTLGNVSQATLGALTAGELAQLAPTVAVGVRSVVPSVYVGPTVVVRDPVTGASAVLTWNGTSYQDPFASYADLLAMYPSGMSVGQTARVNRLIGSGTFGVIWTGTRWAVGTGEVPVRLDDEVLLTAAGTSYTQMASALIGPLIGNYETWLFRVSMRNNGVYTASGGNQRTDLREHGLHRVSWIHGSIWTASPIDRVHPSIWRRDPARDDIWRVVDIQINRRHDDTQLADLRHRVRSRSGSVRRYVRA